MAKYWKSTIPLEVLTSGDTEPEFSSLAKIAEEVLYGDASGSWSQRSEEVTAAEMAELLIAQGSDPEFLLDEDDLDALAETDTQAAQV